MGLPGNGHSHLPEAATSRQLIEQRLCLFQIGGVESLGEPAIDRREEFAGSRGGLGSPRAGRARRRAELVSSFAPAVPGRPKSLRRNTSTLPISTVRAAAKFGARRVKDCCTYHTSNRSSAGDRRALPTAPDPSHLSPSYQLDFGYRLLRSRQEWANADPLHKTKSAPLT